MIRVHHANLRQIFCKLLRHANSPIVIHFSYGFMFGIGCGMVRETSVLMVSQYFKRKRQNVEIIVSMGAGLGLTMFTNLLNELIK